MTAWVGLLRGVNVGGRNRLSMAELKRAMEAEGFLSVQTLLQSGNVVFQSGGSADEVRDRLERVLADGLGLACEVVVRSKAEWQSVLDANPLPDFAASAPEKLLAVFFAGQPPPATVERLRGRADQGEHLAVVGDTLFIAFPNGLGRSKVASIPDGTGRNWNTVRKLREMLETL